MQILFWASAATILYVYLGYPLLLVAWARLRRESGTARPGLTASGKATAVKKPRPSVHPAPRAPGVSIVIAVRDEAHRLPARIQNLLSLDYPGERQIIVASDGSTDNPAAALAAFPYVELVECPPRGKAAALNAGVARARHDVLVFADARQTFAPDALRALVAPLARPGVAGVTGELVLEGDPDDHGVSEGVGLYWQYEKTLRRLESVVGSTLGATGAIYALRRSAWRPLPEDTILDDVLAPMRAVLEGGSLVFEDRAKAFDRATSDPATEARRKIRTLAGNVQILWLEPRLLLPVANPVWLQYVSHKIGRLLVPYALIALWVSSSVLVDDHWFYAAAFIAQTAFYLFAVYGAWLTDEPLPSPFGVKHVRDA